MRILDKNYDYYDYLQDYTDDIVFDRRKSFLLTKEMMCNCLNRVISSVGDTANMLMQCGATYWLVEVRATSISSKYCIDSYSMDVLACWKNYDRPCTPISIYFIHTADVIYCNRKEKDKYVKTMIGHVNRNDFKYLTKISKSNKYTSSKSGFVTEALDVPILKACGIQSLISSEEIYNAIDEYFSIEIMNAERIEAIGTTNNDKIISHGFDLNTSFR